jgi:hypothetical protein
MKTSLKVGAAAAVLAAAGLIAVPMAMAQTAPQSVPAATPTTNPSTSTCTTAQHLAWLWKRVPEKLRADITAAKQLPAGAQRDAALKKVLDNAATGAYGERATRVATRIEKRDGKLWSKLPAALQTDVTAVVNAAPGQPTLDAAAGVFDKASSGAYGDLAKKVATKIAGAKAWTSCKVR